MKFSGPNALSEPNYQSEVKRGGGSRVQDSRSHVQTFKHTTPESVPALPRRSVDGAKASTTTKITPIKTTLQYEPKYEISFP